MWRAKTARTFRTTILIQNVLRRAKNVAIKVSLPQTSAPDWLGHFYGTLLA